MKLCNTSIKDLANLIKVQNLHVVFWGAGTLMQTWIPWIFEENEIIDAADYCVDSDSTKWGAQISWGGRSLTVCSPECLEKTDLHKTVLLVVSSYFAAIIDQLGKMELPKELPCYIVPVMYITHPVSCKPWQPNLDVRPQIPKLIHYCWFGRQPLSEHAKKCIESWHMHCPDYEIKEWNEDNYDISQNEYMQEAYASGCYGYVPDYARIDLLYRYGGFYFDVDVRLIQGLDDLRRLRGFTSFEEYPTINFGGGSGAVAGLEILRNILDFRRQFHFLDEYGRKNRRSCGFYESLPLVEKGLHLNGALQEIGGLTVFPSEYFHPKSTITGQINCTAQTRACHEFGWSWATGMRLAETMETHKQFKRILNRMEDNFL